MSILSNLRNAEFGVYGACHMYKPHPALVPVLFIPGMIYQAGVLLRNRAFDAGLISSRGLPQTVVSVGNLTLGGTGKTPFVIYLAELIKEMGYVPAVLTRGYGRRKSGMGKTIILSPEMCFPASLIGDEPALIRRRLPDTWIGISVDRFCAANAIERQRQRERSHTTQMVFIMDDGFQRRDIQRDLDIVMIDSSLPPYAERLFPLGALREPAAELRRARAVVINGNGTGNDRADAVMENLRKYAPEADFFHCVQRIQTIIPFADWLDPETQTQLRSKPASAFLVAAIGNPERFKRDIMNMGIETRGCAFYNDHAVLGKKDWEICVGAARKVNAEAIIITEKDAVKISCQPDFPVLVAVQNTELPADARFREILQAAIRR